MLSKDDGVQKDDRAIFYFEETVSSLETMNAHSVLFVFFFTLF